MNKATICFGKGSLEQGFPIVTMQLWDRNSQLITKQQSSLTANPQLSQLYHQWRSLYLTYYLDFQQSMRVEIVEADERPLNFSYLEFQQVCQQLSEQFNIWLNNLSFADIRWHLGINLSPLEELQIIIETDDEQIRQLPWNLWNFLADYPLAEVALSLPVYKQVSLNNNHHSFPVKVLGVIGNPIDNELNTDKLILEKTLNTKIEFLIQPTQSELKEKLRQYNWDIFYFAGHSSSGGRTGNLLLNQEQKLNSINLSELEPALEYSIRQGLKLAIFNSCDGLGLAWNLAKLNIPQAIVMSQPVTDNVAQKFLRHFLVAIAEGESTCLAVRQARDKLKDIEEEYPCASWVPILCQNPAASTSIGQYFPEQSHSVRWSLSKIRNNFAIALSISALTIGTSSLGLWQGMELKIYDWLVGMLPHHQAVDDRFLLITVDEADIQYQDRQGMNRKGSLGDEALERALTKLLPYQPKVIALDIYHDSPFEPKLRQKLSQTNFIAACEIGKTPAHTYSVPAPPNIAPEQIGFTDFPLDPDNIIRRQLLFMDSTISCPTDSSLSLRIALEYLTQTKNISLEFTAKEEVKIDGVTFPRLSHNAGGYQLPYSEALGYQVLLNYSVAEFPEISLRDFLEEGIDSQLADLAQDKIILIGVGNSSKDTHLIPQQQKSSTSKVSGVTIHAHIVGSIINAVEGKNTTVVWWWTQAQEYFWIIIWSGVGVGVIIYSNSKQQLILSLLLSLSILTGFTILLFYQGGWIPLVPPVIALATTSIFIKHFNV
ncbi:CHASE2 domain-containing protein [Pleurocapsa sp. PCC 7319]|uniref:CHASE2 domain-containing protein n=1 Tax=Pleurocapsa sp. PCC 7319 TaxID=118161 RepID=UPI00034A8C3C|nr:CHASE2 domain-containing protein [Pleurocapsa sp. PCC 7319]